MAKAENGLKKVTYKSLNLSTANRQVLRIVSIGFLGLLALSLNQDQVAGIYDATTHVVIITLATLLPLLVCERTGSARQVYGLAFFAFHLGLLTTVALAGTEAIPESINSGWLFSIAISPVLTQISLGAMALLLGFLIGDLQSVRKSPHVPRTVSPLIATVNLRTQFLAGLLLYGLGLTFVLTQLALGGFRLTEGYLAYWDAVRGNSLIGYGFLLIAVGAGLAASVPEKRITPWVMVGLVFVLFMPAGVRSAALFPVAVVVAARSKHENFRLLPAVLGMFLLLGAISVVQGSRLEGLRGFTSGINFSPLGALAEMGSSIVSVHAANFLIESGRSYWYGQSFIVVPLRFLESAFFGGVPTADSDYRFMNHEIFAIFGPIGGSPIAEGVRNGGLAGVFIVMLLTGIVVAWVDSSSSSPFATCAQITVFYAVLIAVRNAAAPIIVFSGVGIAASVTSCLLVALLLSRRRFGPTAPVSNADHSLKT